MKSALLLIVLSSLCLSPALCKSAENPDKIEIGWIGPLSGSSAVLGIDAVEAVRIAFDEMNADPAYRGPKLQLTVQDDQYTASKTLSAYNFLVGQRGLKVIFIYTYSGLMALAERAQKDGVLLLDPLDCDEDLAALPENTICIAKLTEDLARVPARHAIGHSIMPAALMYIENDAFPVKMASVTRKLIRDAGQSLIVDEGYQGGMTDFRSILLKARQGGAKSLFLYGYAEIGLILKQLKETGFNPQVYSMANVLSPDIKAVAAAGLDKTIFSNWKAQRTGRYNALIEKLIKRRGVPPVLEVSTVPSYDTALILAEALSAGASIKEHFYSLRNYPGVSGPITVDPDGVTRSFRISLHQISGDSIIDIVEEQ